MKPALRDLRDGARVLRNMVLLLLASVVSGTALMILVYALPTHMVREHINSSIDMLLKEGDYNSWAVGHPYTQKDGFTDAIMLNNAAYAGSGSIVRDAMLNPRLNYDYASGDVKDIRVRNLSRNLNNEEGHVVIYPRYWHGYLIILKPLLLLMGFANIRVINLFLQLMLAFAVLFNIYEKLGRLYAYAFAITILIINPVSTALCLQFSDIYYITLTASTIILYYPVRERQA